MSAATQLEGSVSSLISSHASPPSSFSDLHSSFSTRSTISSKASSVNLSSAANSNVSLVSKLSPYVLVFGPQGTGAVLSGSHTLSDLAAAGGSVAETLLSEAHQAFVEELDHARASGEPYVDSIAVPETLEDFCILCNPHQSHQAVSNVMTALGQALTVLAVARANKIPLETLLSPSTELSIAGLCTGVIAGYAFAAATRPSELVFRIVEALRLAFWLGLRACQCAESITSSSKAKVETGTEDATWCMGAASCSVDRMQDLIDKFTASQQDNKDDTSTDATQLAPWITVVSSSTKLSIGGPPDVLSAFRDYAAERGVRLRFVHLNAPYHSEKVLAAVAEAVRRDAEARNIQLPAATKFSHAFYDNRTGTLLAPHGKVESVVELVIGSMLLDRARWDLIREGLSTRAASTKLPAVTIINAGPDAWYASDLLQAIKRLRSEKPDSFSPAAAILALRPGVWKSREGEIVAHKADSPLSNAPTAVTASFTAIVRPEDQTSPGETLDRWAAQLNSQAPLASFEGPDYAEHLGCFFNDEAAFPEENLGLLRRLVASHGWPQPYILGRVPGSTAAPVIQRGREALNRGLCKIVLVGGVEVAPDESRRVFCLVLELASDATATGHRVQALVVNAFGEHNDPVTTQQTLDNTLADVEPPIYYVNEENSVVRYQGLELSANQVARKVSTVAAEGTSEWLLTLCLPCSRS